MTNQSTRPIDTRQPIDTHQSGAPRQPGDPDQPWAYQIRLQGHLDAQWADWFGGLTVTLTENGDTMLTGPVVDQAVLHGLFRKVRDLGMILISVNPIPMPEGTAPRNPVELG